MCCWNRGKNHGHNSSLHPKTPELQAHKRLVSLLPVRFTPDFTSSRVIRELKLVTCGGSEFVFVLNASLPYHMLAACAESLPRPSWELELYIIVCLIMRSVSPRFFFMVWYFVYAAHSGAPLPPSTAVCSCWCSPRPTWRLRASGSLSRSACRWNPTLAWRRADLSISGKLCKITVIQSTLYLLFIYLSSPM